MMRPGMALCLVAGPAAAHHEVVMVASGFPLLGGLAVIVTAAAVKLLRRAPKK